MVFTIFITAISIPIKQVHKALLSLEDYEYGCDHSWAILRNAAQLDDDNDDLEEHSIPPLDLNGAEILDDSNNAFAGKNPAEIFAFIESNKDALRGNGLTCGNWLIIDERGFRDENCLVCSKNYDEDEEELEEEEEEGGGAGRECEPFLMARLPWIEAWSMFTNLDIANMDFQDWVDEAKGKDENGEYTWVGPFSPGGNIGKEALKRWEGALAKASEDGIID